MTQDPLRAVLLGLLTPLLTGANTDPALARQAAEQAIAAHRGGLLGIAQVVAFTLTALDNLRLSMPEPLSLAMKLRLRGNANALSRTAQTCSGSLDQTPQWEPEPEPAVPEPLAPEPAVPEPTPPASLPQAQQENGHWANAMTTAAAELQARARQVPPQERKTDQLWVEVLTDVARDLRQQPPAKRHSRAELLRTTLLAGGNFPQAAPIPPGK